MTEVVHHYAFHDYLHWGTHISHVWFSWWRIDRTIGFLLTLGALFSLSIVHESLALVRRRMLLHARSGSSVGAASLVRVLEASLSAMLILAIVTFNAWVILSICLGSAVGYYLNLSMDDTSSGYASLEPSLHH